MCPDIFCSWWKFTWTNFIELGRQSYCWGMVEWSASPVVETGIWRAGCSCEFCVTWKFFY